MKAENQRTGRRNGESTTYGGPIETKLENEEKKKPYEIVFTKGGTIIASKKTNGRHQSRLRKTFERESKITAKWWEKIKGKQYRIKKHQGEETKRS